MQKIKKLLALGLSCLALGSSMFFASCETYDCATCKDTGIIDCPNCHVLKCHYKPGDDEYCYKGTLYKECPRCDGNGGIKKNCSCGVWYYDRYLGMPTCTICRGRGYVTSKCVSCEGWGRIKLNRSCSKCVNGYIGGEKCADKSCIVPDDTSKNNGYSYIICPDCGE